MKSEKYNSYVLDFVRKYADSEAVKLPVFSGVASELQKLLADDNTSIDQISDIIEKDQVLATRALRLSNSALLSGPTQVRTIRDSVMRLGFNHIFNLVACIGQRNLYKSGIPVLNKHLQESWKHALCTAIGSKWLVQELGYRDLKDEAFLAGLLHDIGKLSLIKVIELMMAKNDDLIFPASLMPKIFVLLHAEQGHRLMNEWRVPEVFCNVALNHHEEDFDRDDALLMAIRVVNQVCKVEGISTNPDARIDLPALPEVQALGITVDVLDELRNKIQEGTTSELNS
jgi:HD-like signal output (HDOD) protein